MSAAENLESLKQRLTQLGLYGLLAHWEEVATKPWLPELLGLEERERQRRSLERRLRTAKIGSIKPMSDFDWTWPRKIDREAIDELFALAFVELGQNVILLGPNGVGKTLILKNLAHHAVVQGHTVKCTTASDMLADLAQQESSLSLARRLRRYVHPKLLCIDEVGLSDRFGGSLAGVISSQGGGIRLGSVGTRWARRSGCGTRTAEGVPRGFPNQPSEPRRPCALQPCSTPCSESSSLSSRRWSSPRRAWSATSSRQRASLAVVAASAVCARCTTAASHASGAILTSQA